MQMSPESGDDRSPSPESGEHVWPDPAKIAGFRQDTSGTGQIRPDPVILAGSRQDQWPDPVRSGRIPAILARSGRISSRIRSYPAEFRSCWPDPAGSVSGSGQIRPDSGHFGQIRPDQCPNPVKSGRIPAGFCPGPDSGQIPPAFGAVAECRRIPTPAVFRRPDSGSLQYSGGRIPTPALFQ
jgi:hypothetical protein